MAKYFPLKILTSLNILYRFTACMKLTHVSLPSLQNSFCGFLLQPKMSFLLQKNKEYVSIAKGGFMGKLVNGQLWFEKT